MHYVLIFLILLFGCSQDISYENLEGEYITNKENEVLFSPPLPKTTQPRKYPWTKQGQGLFEITLEHFHCKGMGSHPLITNQKIILKDCQGGESHGFPSSTKGAFISPLLVDLLNYVQEKTKKRVVITTGYRCPTHNLYADLSLENRHSLHMLGKEVDFYVDGMQKETQKVIEVIKSFYKETPFARKNDPSFTISPWYNHEITIMLNLPHERRDFDNSHPYAYITLQTH